MPWIAVARAGYRASVGRSAVVAAALWLGASLGAVLWVPVRERWTWTDDAGTPIDALFDEWEWSWRARRFQDRPDPSEALGPYRDRLVERQVRWHLVGLHLALIGFAAALIVIPLSAWRPGGSQTQREALIAATALLFANTVAFVYVPKEEYLSRDPRHPERLDRALADAEAGVARAEMRLMYRLAASPGGRRCGWTVGDFLWAWDSEVELDPGGMFSEHRIVWDLFAMEQLLIVVIGGGGLGGVLWWRQLRRRAA